MVDINGIRAVNWTIYDSSPGNDSPDVPSLLQQLASGEEYVQECAWVYMTEKPKSVLPAVMPFLIQMARSHDVPGRPYLLRILASCMEGIGNSKDISCPERETLVVAIRQAFLSGLPTYQECLSAEDPTVRKEAAYALGVCRDRQVVLSLLSRLEHEPVPDVLTEIMLSLVKLGACDSAPAIRAYLDSQDALVRVYAAKALIELSDEANWARSVNVLIDGFLSVYRNFNAAFDAYETLKSLGEEVATKLTEKWSENLSNISNKELGEYVQRFLICLFQQDTLPVAPSGLSKPQRRVLWAIASDPRVWKACTKRSHGEKRLQLAALDTTPDLVWQLEQIGVPIKRRALLSALEK